uniref:beta-fructofuranosidase n=1 Tax=Meloidogyne hapla TaxID=6305 RepID=A0A1I8BB87_MELHA
MHKMDSPTPQSYSKPTLRKKPFLIAFVSFCSLVIIASITFGLLQIIKTHNLDEPETLNTTTSYSTTTETGCVQNSYSVYVNLINSSILHVWLKPKIAGSTAILYGNISKINTNQTNPSPIFYTSENGEQTWFDFAQLELNFNGKVELSWSEEDTNVSYIYAYEPENVKLQGIRPAFVSKLAMSPAMEQSFHFRPPLGWINDPNGFSRTDDGLYHLYYQHYPHSKRWNSMYWGHAISSDLVNWVHQPIFLRPNDKDCGIKCGLYSGSAVPIHDGLQVFFTDNNYTRVKQQIQRTVYTKDTILPFNESEVFLTDLPDLKEKGLKLEVDFRDPNVFIGPEGYYYMTLGSGDTLGAGGVILLYRSKEKHSIHSGWQFQNVLKTDNTFGTKVCECSQIFQLGGRNRRSQTLYAFLYARMASKDEDGRSNLSPIILGTFDGSQFKQIEEQELDFGAGSFGVQAFYDPIADEAILIGWLANWPDWDRISDWSTSLTLPWVIRWTNTHLLIGPHPNVLGQLRDIELDGKALLRGNVVGLPNGTAIYSVLKCSDDPPNRRFLAADARPDIVHIYIDRDSLEVFGEMKNDGMPRWAGTSRLSGLNTYVDSVQLSTTDRYSYLLQGCQIWSMKPAKFLGRL